jgi:hypothetical protein
MKQKELKEAIFDMFRKSKETSSEPQSPKFKSIDSMLGGRMNLTAGDFSQLNPNTPADELKKAFRTAYLRGNIESRTSLKSLLDKEPYSELKDLVDQIDNAKLDKPMSKLGASDTQSARRSSSGFPGLSEDLLRMQKLAGIITEAEGRNLYTTAGQMISQVGLFTQENADEMIADGSGNLYRFFDTPEERDELIKISEGYKIYLAKVKAMMGELMSDPMYQVAVGDAGRSSNPLEKAYMRAKNI